MFVKPKSGVIVRDPITKTPVSAPGQDVPETMYWLRRLRDGDIVVANQAPTVAPQKSEQATA